MHLLKIIAPFLFLTVYCPHVFAEGLPADRSGLPPLTEQQRKKRVLATTLLGAGVITLWGMLEWDYFSTAPHCQSEGWFGKETESGGADKLGHAYSTYVVSHGLAALYQSWGFSKKEAALFGSSTSFALMGYLELGDAYSRYGFSPEDMVANGIGALVGYLLFENDTLAEKIDFRWEYGFDPNQTDIFTDYENSKYLLAVKLNGFEATQRTLLRNLELHFGYYTRNFDSNDADNERNIYFGIGLNLSDILFRHSWKKTGTVLRYLQLPYTYVDVSHGLD